MHSDSRYDLGYQPRAAQLTADATIIPEPKTTGYYRKVVRQNDEDGVTVWNDADDEEEVETQHGLHYDPTAPPSQYYVLPIMYVPSEGEVQETYVLEPHSSYDAEQYRNQFFTDTRTLNSSQADDHDGRLYYKEFSNIETEAHPPFVEIKSYKSPRLSFLTEPNVVSTTQASTTCRNEIGRCCCGQRKSNATGLENSHEIQSREPPPKDEVCCTPETSTGPTCSTPKAFFDDAEKLYVSVDTHTDNTIVESKSMQTQEDQYKSCCSTQTQSSNESFDSAKAAPAIPNTSSRRLSNDSSKRRTYSILTGQRKSDDNAAVDKANVSRYKSTKTSKCDTVCDSGKPCPSPTSTSQIMTVTKKNKGKL